MAHPCCGLSLRQGTIIVALLDIAGAVLGVFVSVLSLIFIAFFGDDLRTFLRNEELSGTDGKEVIGILDEMGDLMLLVLVGALITSLLQLALATYLYKGAREREASSCQLWWKIKVGVFILGVMLVSAMILVSQNPAQLAVASVIGFVYQAYALWVVQAFIDEIRFGKKLQEAGDRDHQRERDTQSQRYA